MGPIAIFVGWALVVAILGGLMTEVGAWYDRLRKPAWQPPRWAFAPAWTLIFALAAWAGIKAWPLAGADARRDILIVYGVNGVFNLLWSPLFFKWRRPDWALIEVVFLWVSIAAMIVTLAPWSTSAVGLLLPYLAWVSFAAVLNRTIVRLNPRFG